METQMENETIVQTKIEKSEKYSENNSENHSEKDLKPLKVSCILALEENNGIGNSKTNSFSWFFAEDTAKFRVATTPKQGDARKIINVMGSKTFNSIPDVFFKSQGRFNMILTNGKTVLNKPLRSNAVVFSNWESIESHCREMMEKNEANEIFIIGGKEIYDRVLSNKTPFVCSKILLTRIEGKFDCDICINRMNDYLKDFILKGTDIHNFENKNDTETPKRNFIVRFLDYERNPASCIFTSTVI